MPKMPRPRLVELATAALSAVFAGATIVWLFLDRLPPNWDDAWYLTNSLKVYDAHAHGGIWGYIGRLNSVSGSGRPDCRVSDPFYLLFRRRWHAAYLVNIVCMMVLCCVLYRMASDGGVNALGFSVAIAGTMPLLYGLSRWYMVEYPLVALVGVSVWLLIESAGFERRGLALWAGAACGMGMLLKVSFAGFILPAFLYVWAGSRHRLRALLLTAIPCLVLALPWYAAHLRPTMAHALPSGFGAEASVYGTAPSFPLHDHGLPTHHVNGISGITQPWRSAAAVDSVPSRRTHRASQPAQASGYGPLLLAASFAFTSLGQTKISCCCSCCTTTTPPSRGGRQRRGPGSTPRDWWSPPSPCFSWGFPWYSFFPYRSECLIGPAISAMPAVSSLSHGRSTRF
jgi:4-amino-4-deoxy-L-arabinose transferase-like glycosyltransferase